MPDTSSSNSGYGTATDEGKHYCNCSRGNLFWHKKQRYVAMSTNQDLIPDTRISKNCQRRAFYKEDFPISIQGSVQDHARTS